ncbi:hypothetical protein [Aristophania vespae]|uniref:hypothetical protein n=1 Tax=Aristophania vespae TaxID=2697033 RepID=UPI0023512C2B|nr:hypothetical protein [Aristophania vespae]UMM63149.1 hypothetical protein DM15PD_01040 [Aristophania vespae]
MHNEKAFKMASFSELLSRKTTKKILSFLTFILLAACSTPRFRPICPTLVEYSQTDQQALATELLQPAKHTQIVRWISDYIGLRDQVRACQGTK